MPVKAPAWSAPSASLAPWCSASTASASRPLGLIPFSWVAGVWPGSSIIGVLTVAMFFCLFHAYTYSVIGATMPRSAADYTMG